MALLTIEGPCGLVAAIEEDTVATRYTNYFRCLDKAVPIPEAPDIAAGGEKWSQTRKRMLIRYFLECEFQKQRRILLGERDPRRKPWKNWQEMLPVFESRVSLYETSYLAATGAARFLGRKLEGIGAEHPPALTPILEAIGSFNLILEGLRRKKDALEAAHREIQDLSDQWEIFGKVLYAMDRLFNWDDLGTYQVFAFTLTGRLIPNDMIAFDRHHLLHGHQHGGEYDGPICRCFRRHFKDEEI